uniref:DEAD/SNF2-like helicase n=1 Tax=Pithovirus LCPAC202 TaxID=2506592 RepID=A0A481Z5K9_9VIRU|nr:MAG: DEAD/SNF2-like helicase [Pithovirus LCPAC202]
MISTPRLIIKSPKNGLVTIRSPVPVILPQVIQPKPITLYPYQEEHIRKLSLIFQTNYVALDYSNMGRGKTFTSSILGTYYKYPIILITSRTLFPVWTEMETKHGTVIDDKITYGILRGIKGKKCNHPYLIRTPDNKFLPTQYLLSVINEGRLFIFDEMSELKNYTTATSKAAHAIIKAIISRKTKSRALLLSAFPTDKIKHILTLIQLLGIAYSDTFVEYDKRAKIYNMTGMLEVINWCYQRNFTLTKEIISHHSTSNKQSIMKMGTELYRLIISDCLSSCMVGGSSAEIKNGYYPIDKESLAVLEDGERFLSRAVHYRKEDGQVSRRTINWGMVTRGIKLLGKSKLRIMAQLSKVYLTSNPQSKGVICVWFVSHIKWLAEALKEYGAETFYGKTKMNQRQPVIDRFQDPNSSCRILIINPTVGGKGLSLDDRDGKHPRWMLLMPDYRIMDLVQCTGRVYRKSTVSKDQTMIRFVYTRAFKTESKILTSLIQKSDNARIVIGNKSGIRLPDSYQTDDQIKVLPDIPLPPLPDPIEEEESEHPPKNENCLPILLI